MLHKAASHRHLSPRRSAVESRPHTSGDSKTAFWKRRTHLEDVKRDSGLAPSFASTSKDSTIDGAQEAKMQPQVPNQDVDVPSLALNDAVGGASETQDGQNTYSAASSFCTSQQELEEVEEQPATSFTATGDRNFTPLSTDIETGGFEDPFGGDHLSFSKRGSVLLDGQKAFFDGSRAGSVMTKKSPQVPSKSPYLGVPRRSPSTAEKRLSQKVRSMYEGGAIAEESEEGLGIVNGMGESGGVNYRQHAKAESEDTQDTITELPRITSPSHGDLPAHVRHSNGRPGSSRMSYIKMEPWEAAGGIEDYHDVRVGDVDRYGFIRPSTAASRSSPVGLSPPSDGAALSGRTSNEIENPFMGSVRNGKLHKPPPSSFRSHRLSVTDRSAHASRPTSRATSRASAFTARSQRSVHSFRPGSSRHRRWANEAPEMLSAEPGMATALHARGGFNETEKHKSEQRRIVKWEKMAQQVKHVSDEPQGAVGGGQVYAFDTKSPKLIERVWKGIPDVWRAPAWHSFLTASSKSLHRSDYVHDHELVQRYSAHQHKDCLDDIQIDMDVPRTVGQHVMFRSRYRGGQRLLFRVLRALALEHPDTGYVQGMAPLAATLLCYFDEEQAFVAACRLWKDRGLAELFAPGFGGLMSALDLFETKWLAENKAVKKQLEELPIPAMSYGTKWYLTLFNYALPFEAQLRVWDVFILLGGSSSPKIGKKDDEDNGRFDILHAVAMAIIDALHDTLIGAEFENAMSALTGPIRVENEDVLMRVTKREYDERQKRRRKGK